MTTPIIDVRGLGKRYRIGARQRRDTLRETVSDGWSRIAARLVGRKPPRAEETELWAIREVSFPVARGEAIGILGRNGAGKSTLLKVLSRITEPTEGEAILRGHVASLLEVGTGFHGDLTGRENIFLNGAILGMSRQEIYRKFDEIVAFAEVDRFIDTQVKHYSSGMYMRLAFAVAAHLEPDILVVDEVLAVGDTAFQKKCLGKMKDVAGQGRTVLFVSHNMQAIRTLCKRAIWLSGGRVSADGSSEAVIESYLSTTRDEGAVDDLAAEIRRLPPDPAFALLDAAVAQDGARTTSLMNGKPIALMMRYDVPQDTYGLHVYIRVLNADGTLLFESLHNGDADELPLVKAGTYESRVIIPADFLAPGSYDLELNAGIMSVRLLMAFPIRTKLDVHPSGRVNRAYTGYGTRGLIAPLLPWETTRLDARPAAETKGT